MLSVQDEVVDDFEVLEDFEVCEMVDVLEGWCV